MAKVRWLGKRELEPDEVRFTYRDCRWKLLGKERRAARVGNPCKPITFGATQSEGLPATTPSGRAAFGPFPRLSSITSALALCIGMAPSSLLELGQNRLRHGG